VHAYRVAAPYNGFSSCILISLFCSNLIPALLRISFVSVTETTLHLAAVAP